ncbi:RNA-binding protein 28-like isoform X1 [Cynara cardunculus var. scolymus]|uniref:RNA-binding protein 28-like isoform X1 n=2 Tax=Cynara cardunculus var. scolymus TaxID=59895 RepID=UPI000D62508A|nr:RNA-binding protein 28-like isoform X1 [Cynara cardunculus var. scolymus]
MAPKRMSARRKKSSSSSATTVTLVDHELPTSQVETGDGLKLEETDTELLGQVQVSNPNPADINVDSTKGVAVSSKSVIKEEVVLENCEVGDVSEANIEVGGPDVGSDKINEDSWLESEDVDNGIVCIDDQKEDLRQGSENMNEEKQEAGVVKVEDTVVCIYGSQLETVDEEKQEAREETVAVAQEETGAVKVGEFKILNDNNTSLVVKGDGVEEGEKIAKLISSQESNISKSSCKNDAALVMDDGGNGDGKCTAEMFSTQESVQAVSTKAPCENNTALIVEDDSKGNGDDEESDDDSEGDDTDNEGDENPSISVQDPLDNKKEKNIEIYVGKLNKDTVEEDLVNAFQQFGELESTRIVRNSTTNKSKGFAFIRFASVDQAKRALSELKDGVEVRGKHVMISASQNNDTLYLGNICKTWNREEVLQQLKHYGIEHIKVIRLPEDPRIEGKIKGFAFLEFSAHADAVAAFQRLRKPDAIFGRDISAKVAFAQAPLDEDLSQVKQVYVEGLTKAWNEKKLKEICEKYGEIDRVKLCLGTRIKKDFGFVTFTSHESALACVEGINKVGVSELKIKASIAKPPHNSQLQKLVCRGGFKVEKQIQASVLINEDGISKGTSEIKSSKTKGVLNSRQAKRNRKDSSKLKRSFTQIKASIANSQQKELPRKQNSGGKINVEKQSKLSPLKKDGESSKEAELLKMKGDLNSQQAKRKRKASSEQNLKAPPGLRHGGDKGTPKKLKVGNDGQNSKIASKAGSHKRKKFSNYEGHEDGGNRNTHNKKPFKKQKGNMHGRERDNSRNPTSDTHLRKGRDDYRNSPRYIDPYTPKHAASHAYHLGLDSMSTRFHMEMEPHAGYIEPASAKQNLSYSRYVQPVAQTLRQHQTVYLEPAAGSQSQLHSRYLDRLATTQSHHKGYIETAVGPEVQPYRGYRPSAIVQIAHDPYDSRFARAVRHDGRCTGVAYVGGPSLPASQLGNHTSYYQGGGTSYSGGYGSSSQQRAYY